MELTNQGYNNFVYDLQLFGGKGSSTTNVSSYQPTEQEIGLQQNALNYANAVSPNALALNDLGANLLFGSYGSVQADYDGLNQTAQGQITNAQNTVSSLVNGELPQGYTDSMTDAISTSLNNTMGKSLNSLASRGVLNSSVTNEALNDIQKNAADTTAQNYLNNVSALNGLAGQQSTLAGQTISTTAAAQEAAQQPALNVWNSSLGLNNANTSALSALAGQGTTTSTQSTSGGSGLFGGLASGASNAGMAAIFCFDGNTLIKTPRGYKKIKDISNGEYVIGLDVEGKEKPVEVIGLAKETEQDTYEFICEKGSVITTLTQPLMKADGGYYIPYKDPRATAELKNVGKVLRIIFKGNRKVYDLKTSGLNNYIANGFVAQGAYDSELMN